jgi:2-polyprenyl-3-methyl-5-hydroxy-6-metoxy-1,4-benzoquinol methylase
LGSEKIFEMNRSKRRAALASADALSATAHDIPQLMTAANTAYQQRRFANAEVICKQILAQAPTHATCLNLLGVVHQASGRHRLAVKLFAKAIAVDDLDAGFHYNIACSYQAMGEKIAATEHFKAAITLGMSEKRSLEEFIMENVLLVRCIDRVASMSWTIENQSPLTADDIATIAQDILLRCALALDVIHGAPLELLLTNLRSALLRLVAAELSGATQVDEEVVHLFCALAQQCFINEYVFAQIDDETKKADELRDSLAEKLATGSDFSPLMIAAVAAYFPLYSIPNAKSLLDLKWPEYAIQLLRQQICEPLEELDDRPNIPTLTPIDDHTSQAVMQQYDENPYPRWTINPCKVIAGDRRRHARMAISEEPQTQDILIAGCGTGKHPFWIAQHFPHASILAIDLSRANLAYARRKTREEGLQNIEYAQADILRLGAIGRTFDQIDAVGVLHHLADPKAGWRVLLSLLAPTGIMRIGLYSEIARRDVVQARALIAEGGYRPNIEDIRAVRQKIIREQRWGMVLNSGDFYSASGCRDLLFNVMEHRFTLQEIASFLKEQGLVFHGFELDGAVIEKFQRCYPDSEALVNLEYWNAFEADNPKTFRGMYSFTVSKAGRPLVN